MGRSIIEQALRSAESYRKGHELFASWERGEPVDYRDLSPQEWDDACEALDMVEAVEKIRALEGAS